MPGSQRHLAGKGWADSDSRARLNRTRVMSRVMSRVMARVMSYSTKLAGGSPDRKFRNQYLPGARWKFRLVTTRSLETSSYGVGFTCFCFWDVSLRLCFE